jgi:ABC-type polysaccharide/polyol phosphate transport system ATPase subunit
MSETAISVKGVSKKFKIFSNPVLGPIKESIFFWEKTKYYSSFTAVDDVSMEILKGEVVGIIGSNGAGKTTLLKMIAGLLPIDKGQIIVNGKITALLALGVGMNPEFTGKENIYYSGLLLGMSKKEIIGKMDSIIEFAELGVFIDKPIRTYSSGMKARLLFATSMSINPDILIVDEALSTGDAYFVQKSTQKIHQFVQNGATILFVSHNLTQIERLCQRAYVMEKGCLVAGGTTTQMVSFYNNLIFKRKSSTVNTYNSDFPLISGTGQVTIENVLLYNEAGEVSTGFFSGHSLKIELVYINNSSKKSLHLFFAFIDHNNSEWISSISSQYRKDENNYTLGDQKLKIGKKGSIFLNLEPCLLLNRHYAIWIKLYDTENDEPVIYSEYKNISPFFISRKDNPGNSSDAFFLHPFTISSY